MTEPQLVLAILALVRTAAAVAMLDLYRRLRRPSIAPISAGLILYALAPVLTLLLGGAEYETRTIVIQTVAVVLMVMGVIAHFTHIDLRTSFVIAGLGGALALVGSFVTSNPRVSDAVFLVAIAGLAGSLIIKRERFRRVAGNSYEWGLVICAIGVGMYALRFALADVATEIYIDQFLTIAISVAQALYLLNLEFNIAYTELNQSESRYRTLFETAGDSIIISGPTGIVDANSVASKMLGYSVEELRQMTLAEIDDEQSAAMVNERVETIQREGQAVFESTQRRKDGELIPVEVSATRIEWDGHPAVLGLVRDLTERKRNEELIVQMAYYDPLTGLANRSLFNDRLALAVAHAHRSGDGLALLFIDLDHFKVVNDTLGHPVGDQLLAAVGRRLRSLVREGDTVARLGGDEYTLLLVEAGSEADAAAVAWKVLDALQVPFVLDADHDIHTTASIGIALVTDEHDTPETLVRNADIAMFRAKDRGRNMFQFYDPEMNASAVEKFELKNELRRALERGELELHFQPQVRVSDRRIVGAEALLRWHNPVRGDVPPDVFIPLAEESGLIVPIGHWVLAEACRTSRQWRAAGFRDIRCAVNLSARQLVEEDLFAYISRVLRECFMPPSSLELEITESVAMQHAGTVLNAFERFGAAGIRIAIDDFGTGYSSLDRLKKLPIHTLKVAQPFIADLEAEEDSAAIVTTVVVLGQSLGLTVVAEGVETEHQVEFLNSLGCDLMQGYVFSPAVTAERFLELLGEQAQALAEG